MRIETQCLREGYTPKNGEPKALPIYQSTTYKYDSSEHIGKLFDLSEAGHIYSRLSNPTVDAVEKKLAALEGGVGALCTTSGQAATLFALLNICSAGDEFISVSEIYGGSVNLFAVQLKRYGITCKFVSAKDDEETIQKAFTSKTKAVFGEMIANPALCVLDVEKFAKIAHKNGVPLIVDNTFATPVLCRPFEWGADIIVHSTSKYMDGHALQIGGVLIDSGNFDWEKYPEKFNGLTTPDDSYHGLVYTKQFGKAAYITKARVQLMRDIGAYPGAMNAFLLNVGLETLALRMERYCQNALAVAQFLQSRPEVEFVNYPALKGSSDYELTQKYLPKGASGVISFSLKGNKQTAVKFIDSLKLAINEVHVADICTCILHPATSTHRQLTPQQLKGAGITEGLVRLSVGLEHIDDILEDLENGFNSIK